MLTKIDCVVIRVEDIEEASEYYSKVFGLLPQWRYEDSIGLKFSDSDSDRALPIKNKEAVMEFVQRDMR